MVLERSGLFFFFLLQIEIFLQSGLFLKTHNQTFDSEQKLLSLFLNTRERSVNSQWKSLWRISKVFIEMSKLFDFSNRSIWTSLPEKNSASGLIFYKNRICINIPCVFG